MGPIVSPLCCCVSVMSALYDENHLHKKPAAFVGVIDPALALIVTTGQSPIDHPAHRSGAPKTTRS